MLLDAHAAPTNEREMLEQILDVCDRSSQLLSSYGSPYSNGFNSLIECMRYEHQYFMHNLLKTNDHAEFLRQYSSEVDMPPSPGCEVNWMWFLSAFENVKFAQVRNFFRSM